MWLWCETFELFCIFFIVGTTPNVFRLILSQMSPSIYTDWDRPIVRNVRTIRKTETIFPHKNIYIYMTIFTPLQRNLQTAINFMKPSKIWIFARNLYAMTPRIYSGFGVNVRMGVLKTSFWLSTLSRCGSHTAEETMPLNWSIE